MAMRLIANVKEAARGIARRMGDQGGVATPKAEPPVPAAETRGMGSRDQDTLSYLTASTAGTRGPAQGTTRASLLETHAKALETVVAAEAWHLRELGDENIVFLAKVLAATPGNLPALTKLFVDAPYYTQRDIAEILLPLEGGKDVVADGLGGGVTGNVARLAAPHLANDPKYATRLLEAFQDDELYDAHDALGAAVVTTTQGRQGLTDIVVNSSNDRAVIRAATALGKVKASTTEILGAFEKAQKPMTKALLALALVNVEEAKPLVFEATTEAMKLPNEADWRGSGSLAAEKSSNLLCQINYLKALEGNELGRPLLLKILAGLPPRLYEGPRVDLTDVQEHQSQCAAIGLKGHTGTEADIHSILENKIDGGYKDTLITRLTELKDTPYLLGILGPKNWAFSRGEEKRAMKGVVHLPEGREVVKGHLTETARGPKRDHDLMMGAAQALGMEPEGRAILQEIVAKAERGAPTDPDRRREYFDRNENLPAYYAGFVLNPPDHSSGSRLRRTADYAEADTQLRSPDVMTSLRAAVDILAHTYSLQTDTVAWL